MRILCHILRSDNLNERRSVAMERMETSGVVQMLGSVAEAMSQKRGYLIDLDSAIGDGDLGITMEKGYQAAYAFAQENGDQKPGDLLMRCGMQIVKVAPSTMGTLMGTGLMKGGKVIAGKDFLEAVDFKSFFEGFLQGVMDRGKAKRGDKTIVDILYPMVEAMDAYEGNDIEGMLSAAVEGAHAGIEAEKGMMSQHGKAAVFREKTLEMTDPGSAAIVILAEACLSSLS